MGASTSIYGKRISGFAGAVKNYQNSLLAYRETLKTKPASKELAKKKAFLDFKKMQISFRFELDAAASGIKARKGIPLTNPIRATNIAKSSRNIAKLNITSQVQASKLAKLGKGAKFLGNGLAVIDFGSRVGTIHNSYQSGGDWEREMFVESLSFVGSAGAGIVAANVSAAALSLLMVATPAGWIALIVVGVVIGVAAGAAIATNSVLKKNAGNWYDSIMDWI
ncbi:hypothetical protein [Teredinibacter haidensis]|uniref:hypothetical protein n=1 Tax=Teredinibacter haidensis TaxID=2731755 RepID=UPI000A9E075D|nr:hypothetical protein [Teredinibacter haidensis]